MGGSAEGETREKLFVYVLSRHLLHADSTDDRELRAFSLSKCFRAECSSRHRRDRGSRR